MYLNILGTKHPILPGINVIGSDRNGRYHSILVQDKSVCPKHASVRFDIATNKVEILDLCSESGITVDRKPVATLTWLEINAESRLQIGDILVQFECEELHKNDEDEDDVIDCSLEESRPLQGSRKNILHSNMGTSGSTFSPTANRGNSFMIPETQQLSESRLCETANKTATTTGDVTLANELDDNDDSFFIPETQQPDEEPNCVSAIIAPVVPAVKDGPVESTGAGEEYFQLTCHDEGNSNDAMFNNQYVEESQNVMHFDESNKHLVEPRVSILPERSVDSISFQENRNTTMEMSAMVWNESKQELEKSPAAISNQVATSSSVALSKPNIVTDDGDDRSITPEIHFDDEPLKTVDSHRASVTPEILFQDGPDAAAVEQRMKSSPETPLLGFDEQDIGDDYEISLNQEGAFKQLNDGSASATKKANISHMDNIYEMETQPFVADGNAAYDLLTQPLQPLPRKSGAAGTPNKGEHKEVEPYDLQTQPMCVDRKPSFLKSMSLKNKSLCIDRVKHSNRDSPEIDSANMPTQPETLPQSVLPPVNSTMQIDDEDLLTQPLSPPKQMADAFNFDTVPMDDAPLSTGKGSLERKRQLFVKLEDIKAHQLSKPIADPYCMNTQPMKSPAAVNVYELDTQVLPENYPLPEAEVSQFNPQINSTTVQQRGKDSIAKEKEISPSASNKENRTSDADRTTEDELSGEDDEFGMSETIPIAALLRKELKNDATKVLGEKSPAGSMFKIPLPAIDRTVTPKPKPNRKRSGAEMFEFNTPEHPMLFLPKVECIRYVSDQLATSSSIAAKRKPAYHFNDSSSSSSEDESERNAFKKTNVSVALERELERVREDGRLKQENKPVDAKGHSSRIEEKYKRKSEEKHDLNHDKKSHKSEEEDGREHKSSISSKDKGSAAVGERKSSRRRKEEIEKVEKKSHRTGEKREEKEHHKNTHKPKEEHGHSKSASTAAKEKDAERKSSRRQEREKSSELEKKSTRTRGKREEHETKAHRSRETTPERSSSRTSMDRAKPSDAGGGRTSTRIRQKTYKMQQLFGESEDFVPKPTKKSVTSTEESSSSRTTRKRKDPKASAEREEIHKSMEPTSKTGESKRSKPGNGSESSSTATTVAAGRRDHRLRSSHSDSSKKVQENGSRQSVAMSDGVIHDMLGNTSICSTASDESAASRRSTRPRIIFSRLHPDPYRKCIARVGGVLVPNPELAHILVTDRIIRTYKLLCAVAKGIPVVGRSYLDALERSEGHEQLNPWQHLLHDRESEHSYQFSLRDTLLKARKQRLFQDYTVFVTPSTKPAPHELLSILSCAGAKAFKHCSHHPIDNGKVFVISNPADRAEWKECRKLFPNIKIVSEDGFMLSLLRYTINFDSYLLN